MLRRDFGDVVFMCDEDDCEEELNTFTGDFADALSTAKRDGWHTVKDDDGEYHHICPNCAAALEGK